MHSLSASQRFSIGTVGRRLMCILNRFQFVFWCKRRGVYFGGRMLRAVVTVAWLELPPDPGSQDHLSNIVIAWPPANVSSRMLGRWPGCGKCVRVPQSFRSAMLWSLVQAVSAAVCVLELRIEASYPGALAAYHIV